MGAVVATGAPSMRGTLTTTPHLAVLGGGAQLGVGARRPRRQPHDELVHPRARP